MSEFQLIRQIQRETSVPVAGVKLGIGDDAALLEVPAGHYLVAATDTLNAGVHFPLDTSAFDIGYKCLAVNLSDLAAMGAKPCWALLSLSLPQADPVWLEAFTSGFMSLAEPMSVALVGGDTTSGALSVSLTAMGTVKTGRQMLRSGAKVDDLIVVSGSIGGAARELDLLKAGKLDHEPCLLNRPQPRVGLGLAIAGHANACIDISDGLLADLDHLVTASGVGARLEVDSLPYPEVLAEMHNELLWNYQLAGGDDYELLFTLPKVHEENIEVWSRELDVGLSIIGEVVENKGKPGKIHCIDPQGKVFNPAARGYEHFRLNS